MDFITSDNLKFLLDSGGIGLALVAMYLMYKTLSNHGHDLENVIHRNTEAVNRNTDAFNLTMKMYDKILKKL